LWSPRDDVTRRGCDPVRGRWLNRARVPVVSLRSTTGDILASLRDGMGLADGDGLFPDVGDGLERGNGVRS